MNPTTLSFCIQFFCRPLLAAPLVAALLLAALLLAPLDALHGEEAPRRKPNILFIVADDLGYGEAGCYGGKEIPKPHLDAFAAGGVLFSNGYVTTPLAQALAFMSGDGDHESTHAKEPRRDLKALGIATNLTLIPQAPHAFLGGKKSLRCVRHCLR